MWGHSYSLFLWLQSICDRTGNYKEWWYNVFVNLNVKLCRYWYRAIFVHKHKWVRVFISIWQFDDFSFYSIFVFCFVFFFVVFLFVFILAIFSASCSVLFIVYYCSLPLSTSMYFRRQFVLLCLFLYIS